MAMLDSALALGRVLERPVRVLWKLGHQLHCPLERLFEPLPGIVAVSNLYNDTALGRLSLRVRQLGADVSGTETWRREELYVLRRDRAALLERARGALRLRIRGDSRFFEDGPLFQGFRPVPQLAARIAEQARGLERAVGVHVRRTDHAEAMRRSPLEAFLAALRKEREADPATTFFVATDDPEVLARIKAEHGTAVRHTAPRSLDRNQAEAIEDALVDLYCLASCRALIGSAQSTFSRTAWQLRGIPHHIVDVRPGGTGGIGGTAASDDDDAPA
jgi:hypothetical protein